MRDVARKVRVWSKGHKWLCTVVALPESGWQWPSTLCWWEYSCMTSSKITLQTVAYGGLGETTPQILKLLLL